MQSNSIFKAVFTICSVVLFSSCDKDFSEVGASLIGGNDMELSALYPTVIAHNEKVTAVQSNNLPINPLGIYDNPAFGKTTASFVTEVSLAVVDPVIGNNPVIDSVVVDIPYYSTLLSTGTDGNSSYKLDSIYGEAQSKFKLSVYENTRNLRNQNAVQQTFYSDQNSYFDTGKFAQLLNDDVDKSQNEEFFFNPCENRFKSTPTGSTTEVITRTAPSMRLRLNKTFFQNKFFNNLPVGSLKSNDVFPSYFKGLYYKAEQVGTNKGQLANINFSKGTITIYYKEDSAAADGTRVDKNIVVNMSGNTASLQEQSNEKADYISATTNPNRAVGDENLYLRGGEGSLAVLELFGSDLYGEDGKTGTPNQVPDELDIIRKNGWLINQANLVFNINDTKMNASPYEPNRIYLYDYNNSRYLVDYYMDKTTSANTKLAKVIYGGTINYIDNTSSTKRGSSYKFNITNHIRNLVKNDSTNVKLGLVVTESIDVNYSYKLKNASPTITQVPKASVMCPLGTIIYGTGPTSNNLPEDKKVKLEIFYTKPKQN